MTGPLINNTTTTTTTPSNKLEILRDWFSQNKITVNEDLIEIRTPETNNKTQHGWNIIAKKDLPLDEPVCAISKEAVLSIRTTAIADIIEECELGGGLGLALAIMFELSQGSSSPFYGYLQSLPEFVNLPSLWDESQLQELKGTELEAQVLNDRQFIQEDFETHILPLMETHSDIFTNKSFWTFENFQKASTLVSSRAFNVDNWHGDAMVPLADVFNHRTAAENVHIETQGEVCPYCGSAGPCEHDYLDDEEDGEGGEEDDEEALDWEDVEDIDDDEDVIEFDEDGETHDDHGCCGESGCGHDHGHGLTSRQRRALEKAAAAAARGELNEDGEFEGSEMNDEDDDEDMMEMVVVEPVLAGQEVFNTYGNHSNASLLNKYGFCEPNNPYDVVTVSMPMVVDILTPKHFTKAHLESRIGFYFENRHDVFMDVFMDEEMDPEELEHELSIEDWEQVFFRFSKDGLVDDELLAIFWCAFIDEKQFAIIRKKGVKELKKQLKNMRKVLTVMLESGNGNIMEIARTMTSKKSKGKMVSSMAVPEISAMVKVLKRASQCVLELADLRASLYPTTLDADREAFEELKNDFGPGYWTLLLRIGEKETIYNAKDLYSRLV